MIDLLAPWVPPPDGGLVVCTVDKATGRVIDFGEEPGEELERP